MTGDKQEQTSNTPVYSENITWLLKPAELSLKGGNRRAFENILKRNIIRQLGNIKAKLEIKSGRFYLHAKPEYCEHAEQILNRVIGISGWARARICEKTKDDIIAACIAEAGQRIENGAASFKIEAHRADKSFYMDSYALRCEAGDAVLDAFPNLKVDLHNPGFIISIEIREKACIYSYGSKGCGGLPVGSAGRGLLLLSGGIDSPVAGFRIACRGMGIDAIHFHSYPYTSAEARQKVIDIANILASYCISMRLHILNFIDIQKRIKEAAPENWATVLLRMAMMEAAEKIAIRSKLKCLISGESLSQVASQTIENISCTESRVKIPVLRPLIGDDKQNIIRQAEKIGTYKTSILPFEDCCVLFSPSHPVLRGNALEANELYEKLALGQLINDSIEKAEFLHIK